MDSQILYPHLKRARQILPNGYHKVVLSSISEHVKSISSEKCIKLEFTNQSGGSELLLPISKESVFLLNRLAGVIGVTADTYRLSDLVGATLSIQIKYKRIIKIKKS